MSPRAPSPSRAVWPGDGKIPSDTRPALPDTGAWRVPGRTTAPPEPYRGHLIVTPSSRSFRVVGFTPEGDAAVATCVRTGDARRFPLSLLRWRYGRELWYAYPAQTELLDG